MSPVQSPYPDAADIDRIGVVGTGSVGASWIALHLAHGSTVTASDPADGAEARARAFVDDAWPALTALGIAQGEVPHHRLRFVSDAGEAASGADFVQENAPERLDLKVALLAEIDAVLPANRLIGSSTGGIPPSALQAGLRHPERLVVVHPFNPAHLVPLVEVLGGARTASTAVDAAIAFMRRLGKHPIRLDKEATGHLANRLQFALVREAVHCLAEGIGSAQAIDDAVRFGLGPRWALMGPLLTLHLAGGPGGMAGILAHAGPAIEGWWAALGTPRLTPETVDLLRRAAEDLSQGLSITEWVDRRDRALTTLLKATSDSPRSLPIEA